MLKLTIRDRFDRIITQTLAHRIWIDALTNEIELEVAPGMSDFGFIEHENKYTIEEVHKEN